MDGDPNAPNKPEEWLRFARRGDTIVVWKHAFYPELHTTMLYDGPLAGFDFKQIVATQLDSFSVPPPPLSEHDRAMRLIDSLTQPTELVDPQTSATLSELRAYVRRTKEASTPPNVPPVPEESVPDYRVLGNRLRRYLTSSDMDELETGCRAVADYLNIKIREVMGPNKLLKSHGVISLQIPVTEDMIPDVTDDPCYDPRASILKEIHDLFYKAWDCQ